MSHTLRSYARLAGILYLVTHVTSVLAVMLYADASDPARIRAGIVAEFLLALGCLGTGVLLVPVLHRHGPVRAMTFALLRTVEATVIIAGTLPMLVLAWGYTDRALISLHTASFLLGQGLVIGVNTLVLASLLLTSRIVVRPLALLGIIGGILVLASNLAQLLGLIPLSGRVAGALAIPIFAFELWLALTLVGSRRLGAADPGGATASHALVAVGAA